MDIRVCSCKLLISIIGSSKLTVEADFHPMLQAYVNLGYVRKCSHISPHLHITLTRLTENEFITADITGNMLTEWNLAALPGGNLILRFKCDT